MFHASTSRVSRTGFTLIELLAAIAIIGILVALTLSVGRAVAEGGRKSATEATIRTLDQVLDAYVSEQRQNPPAIVEIPNDLMPRGTLVGSNSGFYPLADAVSDTDGVTVNSVGLFLFVASDVGAVQDILAGLDSNVLRRYQPGATEARPNFQSVEAQPELLTAFDAWGNPIRMVHPRFHGSILRSDRSVGTEGTGVSVLATANSFVTRSELPENTNQQFIIKRLRRNATTDEDRDQAPGIVGDSDGGYCPGPRPYFYSAGPDGDPSTTEDNVYTTRPRFTTEG